MKSEIKKWKEYSAYLRKKYSLKYLWVDVEPEVMSFEEFKQL